ncbi:MAG TPA: outer membrane beta-barrel protein [Chthonomonadales bacterium]|nr:outer membrane beta-barrel protein [Chthonomonadales bacterium]
MTRLANPCARLLHSLPETCTALLCVSLCVCLCPLSSAQAPAPAAAAVTAAPPPAPPLPTTPAMTGPLAANPKPTLLDAGPLGKVYITGALSGLAIWQDNHTTIDSGGQFDLSNGQLFLNKTYGTWQYFVQAGAYSLPALGAPYFRSDKATGDFYGAFPQAFAKYAPNSAFNIEAGKLPTLIGAEYTFTFENMNIERGLLWNQENAVNRGVQLNYAHGPLSLAFSWNDGFYSNRLTWISLSITDAINKTDSLALIGGGNTQHTKVNTIATPLYLNNEQIYNLMFTHTAGAWVVMPFLQYTNVPRIPSVGANESASTIGAALYMSYAFGDYTKRGGPNLTGWSLPLRIEYIGSTGDAAEGAPSLVYGPGSNAWSLTLSPTFQHNLFFARADLSYVGTGAITNGDALGPVGKDKSQSRFMLELGVLF